jgi:hypothetical protein
MSTLRIAFIPGLIAGVVSVFTSWLWMGVIFHRYQRETPETWRPEGSRSYIAASLLHVLAAIGIACLFTLVVRFKVGIFAVGFQGFFTLPSAFGVRWRYRFFSNPPSLFVSIALLSSADFSTGSRLPC